MTSYVQTVECISNASAYVNAMETQTSVSNINFQFSDQDPIIAPIIETSRSQFSSCDISSQSSILEHCSISSTLQSQTESPSSSGDNGSDYSTCDEDSADELDDDDNFDDEDIDEDNETEVSDVSNVDNKYRRDMWILDVHNLISYMNTGDEMNDREKVDSFKLIIENEIFQRLACKEQAKSESK